MLLQGLAVLPTHYPSLIHLQRRQSSLLTAVGDLAHCRILLCNAGQLKMRMMETPQGYGHPMPCTQGLHLHAPSGTLVRLATFMTCI